MVASTVAPLMIACLFAGVGAWGAKVVVKIDDAMMTTPAGAATINAPRIAAKVGANTYASELFGANHGELSHPAGRAPMVVLTIPGNAAADVAATSTVDETLQGVEHEGSVTVKFTLSGGATFAANVTGLLWDDDISVDGTDNDGDEDSDATTVSGDDNDPATGITDNEFVTAPGTVASIVSGGRKGDSSITIKVEPASAADTPDAARRWNYEAGTARGGQAIGFRLPKLSDLDYLAGHNGGAKAKSIVIHAEATIISGAFTDGSLTGLTGATAVQSRDSLTVDISDGTTMMIGLEDAGENKAFQYVKGAKDGYLKLATVTIETKQIEIAAKAAVAQKVHYFVDTDPSAVELAGRTASDLLDQAEAVFTPAAGAKRAVTYTIYALMATTLTRVCEAR